MSDFETQLKMTFLEEAEQLLSDCEQSFMDLETNPHDKGVLTKIFRLAHSFKGSAGAAGFEDLMQLAHQLESLLVKLTEGTLQPSPAIVSLLLRANDQLAQMVQELKVDPNKRIDIRGWVDEIKTMQDARAVDAAPLHSAAIDGFEIFEDEAPEAPVIAISTVSQPSPSPSPAPAASEQKVQVHVEESIRVNLRRIDKLVNDVGELVILQTVLYQHRNSIESAFIQKTISQLEKITRQIQDTSMGLRMVPMKPTFQKMQRIIRDSAQALGKQIVFDTTGEETEIDKTVLDVLSDPLVHLIRNAVDHGIETSEERVAVGKKPDGHVKLIAFNRGDNLIIEIHDDGKGLDQDRILKKARAIGLVSANAKLTEQEIYQLIFASGFSTKDAVTSLSGRGVGMDVVKTHVEQVEGSIEIHSTAGKGTCFRIILPLTLALIDGMIVKAGGQRYVVPITAISESLQPKKENIDFVTGRGYYLNLRGETLPVYRLTDIFRSKEAGPDLTNCIAIVARNAAGETFAIAVEDIVGQQQIVIKSLGPELKNVAGVTGAAILGDGRAALIIDMNDLVQGFIKTSSSTSSLRRLA
ncbi:MAG: chemotaxis protein CheA [Proteobacteria bacterium]|nr:MAG: chemotaxis protein CheA [Pseudomonadota bacterium]